MTRLLFELLSVLAALAATAAGAAPAAQELSVTGAAGCPAAGCPTGVALAGAADSDPLAELQRKLGQSCHSRKLDGDYWTHKVCHFADLQQLDGGTSIRLGRYLDRAAAEEGAAEGKGQGAADPVPAVNVSFTGGDACGDEGTPRSATLSYVCDSGPGPSTQVKETLLSVSEPSPCQYHLLFGAPQLCPSFEGPVLALSGSGFKDGARGIVGGKTCLKTAVVSDSLLECRLQDTLSGKDLDVQVLQGGRTAQLKGAVSFAPPEIVRVSGCDEGSAPCATTGGGVVHIVGRNFGASGALVTVGQVPCSRVAYVTKHVHLACTLPTGLGRALDVEVTVGGQQGRLAGAVSYAPPALSRVSGCPSTGCATQGGATLVLSGSNLGTNGAKVRVGDRDCPVTKHAHNSLQCLLPAGAGAGVDVTVTQSGADAVLAAAVSYAPPKVGGASGCAVQEGAWTEECVGGVELTITGSDFGADAGDVEVRVGGEPCGDVRVHRSHTQLVCALPAATGAGGLATVTVVVAGQEVSAADAVAYAGGGIGGGDDDVDFEALGIGGLDEELTEMLRRVALSRKLAPSARRRFGVQHVKGIMLHGPPGVGKTLVARHLCDILHCANLTVVNGPELMHKYLGQSEENLRKVFAAAEAEFAEKGEQSGLHLLVFDEIDAITKPRGRSEEVAGSVYDSVVNTLLTKLDGMNQVSNFVVIGMTNRLDLIDSALLRPGRFEVQIEVGLPDEPGRLQILRIHTRDMEVLDPGVDLERLAAETDRFTGAEIKGLVSSATSFALERYSGGSAGEMLVTAADFDSAMQEVRPAHGFSIAELAHLLERPLVFPSAETGALLDRAHRFVRRLHRAPAGTQLAVLLTGGPGAGKSTLAAHLASTGNFSSVQVVRAADLVEFSPQRRLQRLTDAFHGAEHGGEARCVVLDDVDRLVELQHFGASPSSAQLTFSQQVVQTLLLLLSSSSSSSSGRTLVIATATSRLQVQKTSLADAFDVVFDIPAPSTAQAVALVAARHDLSAGEEQQVAAALRSATVASSGMRKVLLAADLSCAAPPSPGPSPDSGCRFSVADFRDNLEALGLLPYQQLQVSPPFSL